jgi:hypothetical protein
MHTFKLTFDQAVLVPQVVDSHMQALKNWTASAVENGNLERAQRLVKELREYERLYAAFNVKSKQETARHLGKPMSVEHSAL